MFDLRFLWRRVELQRNENEEENVCICVVDHYLADVLNEKLYLQIDTFLDTK